MSRSTQGEDRSVTKITDTQHDDPEVGKQPVAVPTPGRRTRRFGHRALIFLQIALLAIGMIAPASVSAAPPAIDLEQCRNGAAADPNDCADLGGNEGWVTGNVGEQQGHLAESLSIPYRAVMTDLPTDATVITLILGYDIKHSNTHAIDYLTHYDRLEPHSIFGHTAEDVLPIDGTDAPSTFTTFPIPVPDTTDAPAPGQPATSFNALPADERVMTLFGGTITNVVYVSQGDLTAEQAETQIAVTFTASSADAVLAWGGHIASRTDWGFEGDVPRSAGGISGSPYHMRLKTWNLNNLGNQDRSLSAATVIAPPVLEITKTADNAVVNAGDEIGFTITVENSGAGAAFNVSLSDPLPAGSGVDWSIDGTTGSPTCAIDGSPPTETLGCTLAELAAGASFSVHITSGTSFASCASYPNTATVGADNFDPITASDTVTVQCPDLSVTKTADDTTVNAGDDIGFSITVSNAGPGTAVNVTLNDPLPAGSGAGVTWTIDGGTNAADCAIVANVLDCDFGDLASGGSADVHVTASTGNDSCGTYDNTATASADNHPDVDDDALIEVVNCGRTQLTPTGTECSNFAFGTPTPSQDQDELLYGVKAGTIKEVNPGAFILWDEMIAPASSFTVTVDQSAIALAGTPLSPPLFSVAPDGPKVFDADCNRVQGVAITSTNGDVTFTVSGVTAGDQLYVTVKYDSGSISGTPISNSPQFEAEYTWTVLANGANNGSDSLILRRK